MYSQEGIESLLSENHALKEEIAQLRAGLQSIIDYEGESWMEHCDIVPALKEIAMNTLKGGAGE